MNTSAPSLDYEAATTSAQNAYKAYTEANRVFKEKYSWRREPERCIGYHSSKKELNSLQETCTESTGKMIGYFLEEYQRLAGELKGRHMVDRWNAERKAMAVWDYMEAMEAANRSPDPEQLKKLIDDAFAEIRQPSTSPAIEYAKKTINQIFAGGTTDNVTALGTGLLLAGGASGLDFPLDIWNLGYDIAHINEIPKGTLALDALAFFPILGASKYGDDGVKLVDDVTNGVKKAFKSDIGTDAVKTAGKAMDNGDEIIDTVGDVSYNGIKRYFQSELMPADLMDELANSGVKYTRENVVMVTKNSNGDLLWLETGNANNGWTHIIQKHGEDFRHEDESYYSAEEIQGLMKMFLDSEPIAQGVNKNGPYAVYDYNGKIYRIGWGDNGFIKSFYPIGREE